MIAGLPGKSEKCLVTSLPFRPQIGTAIRFIGHLLGVATAAPTCNLADGPVAFQMQCRMSNLKLVSQIRIDRFSAAFQLAIKSVQCCPDLFGVLGDQIKAAHLAGRTC